MAMDAIRHHTFGPPETLVLEHLPDPVPRPGQVLIAATAHGVHLLDTAIRRGEAAGPLALPRLPTVPGREVAGTVTAVGEGVEPSWAGRRVAAHLGPTPDGGGYARLVAVDATALHPLDDDIDDATAVAMVGTGRTALMVARAAAVRPEEVVVITAAAGGLGSLLVQHALGAGARVLALAGGPDKVRTVRHLALDAGPRLAVVDHRSTAWADAATAEASARTGLARLSAASADVVLDGVGGPVGTTAARLLRPGGRLVVHGWASGTGNALTEPDVAASAGIDVRPVVGPGAPDLGDPHLLAARALGLAADGAWRVLTHQVPFAEAARAHRELEERRTTGKVVLV